MEEGGQKGIREGQTKILSLLLRDYRKSRVLQVDNVMGPPA